MTLLIEKGGNEMKKKIKLAAIGICAGALLVMIIAVLIASYLEGLFNIFNFSLYSGDGSKTETQQVDKAYEMLYKRVADTSFYSILSNTGDQQKSIYEKVKSVAQEKFPDLFKELDYTEKYSHNANGQKVLGLKKAGSFPDDAENYIRDEENREKQFSIVSSPEALMILNSENFNKGDISGNIHIVYPEAFTKPVAFVYDFYRTIPSSDPEKTDDDFQFVLKRDEDGKVINLADKTKGKIYDYIIAQENSTDYYKRYNGQYFRFPISYQVDNTTKINKYGSEVKQLKRQYYDIDKDGNPIVPAGVKPPQMHYQLVPLGDDSGQLMIKSLTKYNIDETKNKKPIMKEDDEKEIEARFQQFLKDNPDISPVAYNYNTPNQEYYNARALIQQAYEDEKLHGIEGMDWEWDYQGQHKQLGEMQSDGSLVYKGKESEFRFVYYKDQVYDRVFYSVNGNTQPVRRDKPDNSWMNKNTEYAWDFSINKAVKQNGEVLPMEIQSVRDYGLASIFNYYNFRDVKANRSVSVDEQIYLDKFNEFMQKNYNAQFSQANEGYIPKQVVDSDVNFKKYVYNTPMFEYVKNLVENFSTKIQTANLQGYGVGTAIKTADFKGAQKWDSLILKYSQQYGTDPALIRAMIAQESSGVADAHEGWGWGLGQIENTNYNYKTWDRAITFGNETIHMLITMDPKTDQRLDPDQNIRWMCAHLGLLVKEFNGDQLKALAAYNMGSGAITKLLKAFPTDWVYNLDKVAGLLGKTKHGDPTYLPSVLRYYDGSSFQGLDFGSTTQSFGVDLIPNLITAKTIDDNTNFVGDPDWEGNNPELNKNIKLKGPVIEGNIFNGLNVKDQFVNPEKYYTYLYDVVNQDNRALEYWMPAVASVKEWLTRATLKDTGVNGEINFSKFSYNNNLPAVKQEVTARGEYYYVTPADTKQIFLIDEALTFAGQFKFTYKDATRTDRALGPNEQKSVIGLYDTNRYWLAKEWEMSFEVEKTREVKETTTNADGSTSTSKHTETYTETIPAGSKPINLEIYQKDVVDTTYHQGDAGKVLLTNGFKHGDYTNAQDIKVPNAPSYSGEGTLKDVIFTLKYDDHRNDGELKQVYRYYYGSIQETRPFDEQTYFNGEILSDWRQRMTVTDEQSLNVTQRIRKEEKGLLNYLEDYIRNFECDVPNQVIKDYKAFARTEDIYDKPVQALDGSKTISQDVQGYQNSFLQAVSDPIWAEAFRKMGLDHNFLKDKNSVAQVLMALVEEERLISEPNRKGWANIYSDARKTSINTDGFYDKNPASYQLLVNGARDQRDDPYSSIYYVSYSMRNLVLRYDGSLIKAIMAYHIGPEVMDILLERESRAWAQCSKDEILNLVKGYSRSDVQDINPQIVESVISYLNSTASQKDIVNTNTKWYQELWQSVKDTTKDIANNADKLADKLFGPLYTTKENKGIYEVIAHQSFEDYQRIINRIISMKKKVPFETVEWQLFDFFGASGGASGMVSGAQKQTPTLDQYKDLIYNIDKYITPFSEPAVAISSGFGARTLSNGDNHFHKGIDLCLPKGAPISSIADGEVIASGFDTASNGGMGYYVFVKHPLLKDNPNEYIVSIYGHMLKQPEVAVGDKVEAGRIIGYEGNSGYVVSRTSDGTHLHFQLQVHVTKNNPYYDRWMQIIDTEHGNTINPFWFSVAKPTQEQINSYSQTKMTN